MFSLAKGNHSRMRIIKPGSVEWRTEDTLSLCIADLDLEPAAKVLQSFKMTFCLIGDKARESQYNPHTRHLRHLYRYYVTESRPELPTGFFLRIKT